ncbi:hypothetical protein [Aureimonas glaciei]|uniref:Uncharacterized protein n=1 Tax=Aureimonas glaciei TaxID=1776957 RepID=A0A917DE92_9HYPH|nr:hypothetical protein [Aureimonas glaciei]GGD31108.1 hypothetical protein GCM10011335_37670 [Aureimonas glaciei]
MRKLLSRVIKALRSILRALRRGAVYGANWLDGFAQGLFSGAEDVEEFEDNFVEERVVDEVQEKPRIAARDLGVAQRVKNCVLAIDAGRPTDQEFDLSRSDHRLANEWVMSLNDSGVRALRHMPMPALSRHLDISDSFRGSGLPRFPVTANEKAPVAVTEAPVDFKCAERHASP